MALVWSPLTQVAFIFSEQCVLVNVGIALVFTKQE